jgi:hypothetical protein
VPPRDHAEFERLHQKYKRGEELTPQENRWVEGVARVGRRNVRDEAAERRLKPAKTVETSFCRTGQTPA